MNIKKGATISSLSAGITTATFLLLKYPCHTQNNKENNKDAMNLFTIDEKLTKQRSNMKF